MRKIYKFNLSSANINQFMKVLNDKCKVYPRADDSFYKLGNYGNENFNYYIIRDDREFKKIITTKNISKDTEYRDNFKFEFIGINTKNQIIYIPSYFFNNANFYGIKVGPNTIKELVTGYKFKIIDPDKNIDPYKCTTTIVAGDVPRQVNYNNLKEMYYLKLYLENKDLIKYKMGYYEKICSKRDKEINKLRKEAIEEKQRSKKEEKEIKRINKEQEKARKLEYKKFIKENVYKKY